MIFLSTPSGWRATAVPVVYQHTAFISIHALRVEGDKEIETRLAEIKISIHALRVEGDSNPILLNVDTEISIHALRVEGDMAGKR